MRVGLLVRPDLRGISGHLLLDGQLRQMAVVRRAIRVRDEPLLPCVHPDDVHPVVLAVEHVDDLAPLHLQLIVDAGREVVEHDHLAVGGEAVLLLDAHADKGLYARRASDPAHARGQTRAAADEVLVAIRA